MASSRSKGPFHLLTRVEQNLSGRNSKPQTRLHNLRLEMRPWRRTNTGDSTLVDESASRRRNTIPFGEAPTAGRVQDRYPAYEDFPWEKIKEYLLQKWPNWTDFNEARVSHVVVGLGD